MSEPAAPVEQEPHPTMAALPAASLRRLSGFCNPSWDPDTPEGAASHRRCRKPDCPCTCGLGTHAPATDSPPLTFHGIPVETDDRLPEGTVFVGPAGMAVDEMTAAALTGSEQVAVIARLDESPRPRRLLPLAPWRHKRKDRRW